MLNLIHFTPEFDSTLIYKMGSIQYLLFVVFLAYFGSGQSQGAVIIILNVTLQIFI